MTVNYSRPHRPSVSAYVDGCRNDCCRELMVEKWRARRARERAADPVARYSCVLCGEVFRTTGGRDRHEQTRHEARVA